jgi:hypothetical protein
MILILLISAFLIGAGSAQSLPLNVAVKEDQGMSILVVLVDVLELESESELMDTSVDAGVEVGADVGIIASSEVKVYSQLMVDCSLPSDRRGCTSSFRMKVYFLATFRLALDVLRVSLRGLVPSYLNDTLFNIITTQCSPIYKAFKGYHNLQAPPSTINLTPS